MASMYYLSAAHPFAVPCIKFPPAEVCLQDADPGFPAFAAFPLLLGVLYVFPLAFLLPFKYTPSLDFPPARPLSFLCSFRFDCRTLVYVSSYVFGCPAPSLPFHSPFFVRFPFRFLFLFMACFEPCLNWFKISWHRLHNAPFWQAQPQWTDGKGGRWQSWAHNFVTHN